MIWGTDVERVFSVYEIKRSAKKYGTEKHEYLTDFRTIECCCMDLKELCGSINRFRSHYNYMV